MSTTDVRPRPCFERKAAPAHEQFSLVSNTSFQFWDSNPEPRSVSDEVPDAWWYQTEEPDPPEGWVVGSKWWVVQPSKDMNVKSRIIYHRGEARRLDSDQVAVLQHP